MGASKPTAPISGAANLYSGFGKLPEAEQVELLIKLFNLGPILKTPKAIEVTGDTRTDFYARQDPKDALFDPTYPLPIGGRRSDRATRQYWTVEILSWRVRRATSGLR
jgi:hypothetical protein